jgi:WD40 repeat protein
VKGDYEGEFNVNLNSWDPWSPSGDRFLTFTYEGPVKIWDAGTGEALHTLSGHQDMVTQAYWSPDEELIATASADGSVIVWEADTGNARYTFPGGFETEVFSLGSWSPSGDRFATRGAGGVKVYDAATGRQLLDLSVPGVHFWQVSWSPDGMLIMAAGRDDGIARIWDAENGEEIDRLEDFGHAYGLDWSPAGDLAAAGGIQDVKIWDRARGLETLRLSGSGANSILAFSLQGQAILTTGGQNIDVKVFDLSEAYHSIPIPDGWISGIAWSPSGEQFSASLSDGTARVWDTYSGEELLVLSGHEGTIYPVHWSPLGDRILTSSEDSTAKIWDAITGEDQLTLTGHEGTVIDAEWSPDAKWIATSGEDGKVIVWDATTGAVILTFSEHQGWVNYSVWSPDGTRILSAGGNGEAMIWDAFSGEVLLDLFPEDFSPEVTAAAWIMDGKHVVLRDAEGVVYVFDSGTGEEIFKFSTLGYGYGVYFSPTEERVLICNSEDLGVVWNMDTGIEIISYDIGGWVECAYSPDGSRVLIGNDLGSLQVFPAWQTTQELIDYAYECCVFRDLTAEERELFGLPER